ncbi:MAG: type II CAAX prenyl endopeptidase Rce1 family protein [Archangium sp.]
MPSARFFGVWTVFTLGAYVAIGSTVQMLHLAWGLWFSEVVLFAGLATIGWQLNGLSARRAFGASRVEGRSFATGFVFGAVNYAAWALPLMFLAEKVFPKSWVEAFDSARLFERNSQLEVSIAIAGATLAAPFCEELFFRGFVQRAFPEAPRGIVMTAIIFSAFHFDPVGFTARFELGVLFGLLAWKAGSVWPAIGAHVANNAVSTVLFYATKHQAEEDLAWWIPALCFVLGNAALFALVKFRTVGVREPAALVEIERKEPAQWFAPWLLGGFASLLVLLAVDWRGVALNFIDARTQPSEAIRKRDDVKEKRRAARSGDATLEDYEALIDQTKR